MVPSHAGTVLYAEMVEIASNNETLQIFNMYRRWPCKNLLLANKNANTADMHKELGLFKLAERRNYHLSMLCHKNCNCDTYTSLSTYFVKLDLSKGELQGR